MPESPRSVDRLEKNGKLIEYRFPAADFGAFFGAIVARDPQKVAAVHLDIDAGTSRELTYGQLHERARRLAALLRARGLGDGERFCIAMGNRLEALECYLAAQLGRLVAVPMDLEKDPLERKLYKLRDSGARALVLADDYKDSGRCAEELVELKAALPPAAPLFSVGEIPGGELLEAALAAAPAPGAGWLRSGDLGSWKMLGGRKHFFIQGRKKELIIKGGVNISPLAIEDALLADFPELQAAYAIGVPDERFGEEICAVLVFREALASDARAQAVARIAARVREGRLRNLGKYESPAHFLALDDAELPKTSTGKIQRAVLRARLKASASQS